MERRLSSSGHGPTDGPSRSLLLPTIAARPRSSSPAAKWGFLFQGQRYNWQDKRRGDAGPRSVAASASSTSCRTTINWPIPRRGVRVAPLTSPGRISRDDRAARCWPANAAAVSRAGVRRVEPVSLFQRLPTRASKRSSARGPREFLSQFRSLALARDDSDRLGRSRAMTRSRDRSSIRRANSNAGRLACTATCCGCGATTRCCSRHEPPRVDGGRAVDRRVRVALLSRSARRRSAAGRKLRPGAAIARRLPEPLLAPPAGWPVDSAVVAEIPATAARRHALDTVRTAGRFRGRAAAVLTPVSAS